MLKKETIIGLTFGQIISVVLLFGTLATSYATLNSRITKIEVIQDNQRSEMYIYKNNLETIRSENREDHISIAKKLDESNKELETKLDLLILKMKK